MKAFIMTHPKAIYTFIVIAFIINLAVLYKSKNDKQILIDEKENLLKIIEHNNKRIFSLRETLDLYTQFNDTQIPKDLQLINEDGETIMLQSLLANRDLMIFRISENHCISCIQQFNEIINSNLDLSSKNIICISNYDAKKKLTFYKNIFKLKIPIYTCKNINIPIEEAERPYFFQLDKDLKIHFLFFPLYSEPENSIKYIQMIKQK